MWLPKLDSLKTPENVLLIMTLCVALVLVVVQLWESGFSFEAGVLLILSGLTFAQLTHNFAVVRLEKNQMENTQLLKDYVTGVLKPRKDIPPLEDYVSNAQSVLIIGRTLKWVSGQLTALSKLLDDECTLQFVYVAPDSADSHNLTPVMPGLRDSSETQAKHFRGELDRTLECIKELFLTAQDSGKGKVHLHEVDYISNISIVYVKNKRDEGRIIVELMPYRCEPMERPHFQLSELDPDPNWYQLFKRTCERIYRDSTPVDLSRASSPNEGR